MNQQRDRVRAKLRAFFETDRPLMLLLALVVLERLLFAWRFGTEVLIVTSDSENYYKAGLVFAKTGMLTYNGYISALIMPGPTVIIGILAHIF